MIHGRHVSALAQNSRFGVTQRQRRSVTAGAQIGGLRAIITEVFCAATRTAVSVRTRQAVGQAVCLCSTPGGVNARFCRRERAELWLGVVPLREQPFERAWIGALYVEYLDPDTLLPPG